MSGWEALQQGAPDPFFADQRAERILKNVAECRLCGDIIESKHRHDFVRCGCGEIFTDGGTTYLRRGASDLANIIDRSEVSE
jgi:hypothetical protein